MQLSIANYDWEKTKKKNYYELDLHLTDRDFQVFRFLLEMKFASREAIAEKFFWSKDQKSDLKSTLYTRDRLYKLQKYFWISAIHFPGYSKNYFQANWKAYYEVIKRFPSAVIPKPNTTPDYRTMDHDLLVLKSRVLLESKSEALDWISDKTIRTAMGELSNSDVDCSIPDGIYLTSDGQKVAFEFERVQKSKTQYREKIKSLVRIARTRSKSILDFQKIHFVCLTDAGFKFLKEETKIYGDLFLIERSADFFNTNLT